MEYNINGMAPQQPNIFKRAWQSITLPHYGRTIGFLTLLVITLAVPATIAFLNQRTTIKNQAAGGVNGILQFSSSIGGPAIPSTSNPELYLKISLPEGWEITTQGGIQKSSPVAYSSTIKNIIPKAYAATFCTSPAVCSTKTGVPADQWTPTGDTCVLNDSEGNESEGACYIRNTGGGSTPPTATPQPTQPASETSKCTSVSVTRVTSQDITYSLNYTGQKPAKTKDWISANDQIGVAPGSVTSWTPVYEGSFISGQTTTRPINGFDIGTHALLVQLINNDAVVTSCTTSFTIGNPSPTPESAISPANGAQITGNSVQLRWPHSGGPPAYHVRVNNQANQTVQAVNVSREQSCPNNLFVCHVTNNYWLDIPLPNNGTYSWWVDLDGGVGRIAEGSFTVSGSSGTPPGQGVTLTQIHIQNTDGGSGGHEALRITGKTALTSFFSDPYWKLNTTANNTTRTVQVVFYGTDAQGNPMQRTTEESITYTGTTPPTLTPTRTPSSCERKPSIMGPLGDVVSDDLYVWVQVDKSGQPLTSCSDVHDNNVCTVRPGPDNTPAEKSAKNADCPPNTFQGTFVNSQTSNWCRSIPGGNTQVAHCWQLRYIGPPGGPSSGVSPTSQLPVPTVRPGDPTPTTTQGCTYTQTVCSGANQTAADKVCTDANINSNWCYAGKCVTCTAGTTPTGTPPAACQNSYTISGRVTKQDSQPVEGATVCLDPSADGYSCTSNLTAITNASGNYTITIPQGEVNTDGHNVYALKKVITAGSTQGTIIGSTPILLAQNQLCRNNTGVNLAVTFTLPGSAPVPTPIPTATPSITPPPPGPASVTFKVILAGIGVKANKGSEAIVNDRPNHRKRDATLYLYEPGVDATGDFAGAKTINNGTGKIAQPEAIIYDNDGKFVAANFNLSDKFTSGQYQVFVWTPGYLRKRIPNIQTFNTGTNTISQTLTLKLGDANNDNELNTLDFREYRLCLNQQTTSCLKADFNDDGYLDNDDKHSGKEGNNKPSFLDYNLFVSEFDRVSGD